MKKYVNFGSVSLGKSENGSFGSGCIKGTDESTPEKDSSLCHSVYITFCIHYPLHNYAIRMSGVKGSKLLHKTQNFPNICLLLSSCV